MTETLKQITPTKLQSLITGGDDIGEKLKSMLTDVLNGFKNKITEFLVKKNKEVKDELEYAIKNITNIYEAATKNGKETGQKLIDNAKINTTMLMDNAAKMIDTMKEIFEKGFDNAKEQITQKFSGNIFQTILQQAMQLGNFSNKLGFDKITGPIKQKIENGISNLTAQITPMLSGPTLQNFVTNQMYKFVSNIAQNLLKNMTAKGNGLKQKSGQLNDMLKFASKPVEDLKRLVGTDAKKLLTDIGRLLEKKIQIAVKNIGTDINANFIQGILKDADFTKIGDKIQDKLSQKIEEVFKTVTSIMEGGELREKVKMQLQSVINKVQQSYPAMEINKYYEEVKDFEAAKTVTIIKGKFSGELQILTDTFTGKFDGSMIQTLIGQLSQIGGLKKLMGQMTPKLGGEKIQGIVSSQLQNVVTKILEILTGTVNQKFIQQFLSDSVRNVIQNLPNKNIALPTPDNKEVNNAIMEMTGNLTDDIKKLIEGDINSLVTNITKNFATEKMQKLLEGGIAEISQLGEKLQTMISDELKNLLETVSGLMDAQKIQSLAVDKLSELVKNITTKKIPKIKREIPISGTSEILEILKGDQFKILINLEAKNLIDKLKNTISGDAENLLNQIIAKFSGNQLMGQFSRVSGLKNLFGDKMLKDFEKELKEKIIQQINTVIDKLAEKLGFNTTTKWVSDKLDNVTNMFRPSYFKEWMKEEFRKMAKNQTKRLLASNFNDMIGSIFKNLTKVENFSVTEIKQFVIGKLKNLTNLGNITALVKEKVAPLFVPGLFEKLGSLTNNSVNPSDLNRDMQNKLGRFTKQAQNATANLENLEQTIKDLLMNTVAKPVQDLIANKTRQLLKGLLGEMFGDLEERKEGSQQAAAEKAADPVGFQGNWLLKKG